MIPDQILLPVDVELTWSPSEDEDARGSVIYQEDAPGEWTRIGETSGVTFPLKGLLPNRPYSYAVATVFKDGRVAARDTWALHTVIPGVTPTALPTPAAPANFGAAQDGGILHFHWTPTEDGGLTHSYEIREGSAWGGALLVGSGLRHPSLPWAWWSSGSKTYRIKGVRRDGTYGAESTYTIVIKALEDHVTHATTDESGGGFTGTKTATEVSGGDLRNAAVPSPGTAGTHVGTTGTWLGFAKYKDEGRYTTAAIDAGALQTERIELVLAASVSLASGLVGTDWVNVGVAPEFVAGVAEDPGTKTLGQMCAGDGTYLGALPVLVEIDTTPDSGGSPAWDGWKRYVPGVYTFRQYRFRLTLYGTGFHCVLIDTLQIVHRKRNKKAEGTVAVAGTPGPTAITFPSGLFVDAPSVLVTVKTSAGTELVARVTNIDTSGADIRVYDAAGAEVFTGDVYWGALGT